ncbi:hypothetical protein TIFTF001_008055 [Ficus carica]|uniref:NmrA-like domain-containing protein n=1 Tax=Ficus carica TaxID=3494 RepID=A0AA87ZRG8_FICCA|nr:hypothetical protein TIFTF001_008055 [Ficus carica]
MTVSTCVSTAKNNGRVLIVGATGFIGQFVAEASLHSGRPTYILVRSGFGNNLSTKATTLKALQDKGATLVHRFLPSEFGHDVDRADPVEPGLTMYIEKRKVRRAVEESGVPYTYICCNSIASWPYFDNTHPSEVLPPLDQFQIYGDGTVKGTPPHQSPMLNVINY